jgi:acyl-coenzyme A synthetase/AMP-(fatty) acid ligase
VRGFRIELSEVEFAIAEDPAVKEVAVAVREDREADQRLVAYVVPQTPIPDDTSLAGDIRRRLKQRLPETMLPDRRCGSRCDAADSERQDRSSGAACTGKLRFSIA